MIAGSADVSLAELIAALADANSAKLIAASAEASPYLRSCNVNPAEPFLADNG